MRSGPPCRLAPRQREHSFDFLVRYVLLSLLDIMRYNSHVGAKTVCLEKDIFSIRGCMPSIISFPL